MTPTGWLVLIMAVVAMVFCGILWLGSRIEPDEQGHDRVTTNYD